MRINLLNGAQDYVPKPRDVSWEDLVSMLTTPIPPVAKEDAPAWVPAHFENHRRGTVNARAVCALVLDCDDFTAARWTETLERLDSLNLAYVWHTTSSHTPVDGALRFRVAVRLSRDVEATKWKPFYRVAAVEFTGASDRSEIKKITQTCDPGRIYFVPVQGPHFACGVSAGTDAFDVEVALEMAASQSVVADPERVYETSRRGLELLAERAVKSEWDRVGQATLSTLLNPGWNTDYASHGGRDDALFTMANFIARYMPLVQPESVVAHLLPGLRSASVLDGEGECRHADGQTLQAKLERALDEVRMKWKEGDPEEIAKAGRSSVYNEQEISQFLEDQKVQNKGDLLKQLIIQHRSNLYVFTQGDYIYAGSRENSELLIYQELQPAMGMGLEFQKVTKDGIVEKDFKEIYKHHTLAVRNVEASFSVRKSYVDKNTRTLWHAVRPRRMDLVPVHDPAVETWLATWGDSVLLDWLATAPKLEKATAALYLRGVPRSGKTMLAQGLAAIWGTAATEMDSLKDTFNDELTQNPVVFADETVSKRYREDSGLLRRLITATSITLNRKYMETVKLHGSCRVIIAKNHLSLFNSSETMTRDDVDALAQRILYYHMPKAAPYFHPLRLAQHILWLEENHVMTSPTGDRLWVQGRDSELHRHMRISSNHRALVCQWVMEMLTTPSPAKNMSSRLLSLKEGVSISPRCIYRHWDMYCMGEKRPALPQVSSVLGEIGMKSEHGRYLINNEDLRQWAEANSYATDIEEMVAEAQAEIRKTAN